MLSQRLMRQLDYIKANKTLERVLIIGGNGQIGEGMYKPLEYIYGEGNILITDKMETSHADNYIQMDAFDSKGMKQIFKDFRPDMVMHLVALLSANCERNPDMALSLNNDTFKMALDNSRDIGARLYTPSTIGAYGFYDDYKMRKDVHEDTYQRPRTMYGVTKVFMELLGQYYSQKYGLDFRCLRLPGVLSAFECNGGTTDYAIEMIFAALKGEKYKCFMRPEIDLPFIYIDDLIINQIRFFECDIKRLNREIYNLSAFSVSPRSVENFLRQRFPDFEVEYVPDFRNQIAQVWPANFLSEISQREWDMMIGYDFEKSFTQMIDDCENFLKAKGQL